MKSRANRRSRWRKSAIGSGGVSLISMMDILVTLLLFLLKSYVSGEVMVPPAGVTLPTSTAQQDPASSLIVAIDHDAIRFGGERVASVSETLASNSPEIPGLTERLQGARATSAAAGGASPAQVVTIQGDRDVEYRLLRKVMFTLSRNGYDNVSLAVLRKA